MIGAGRHRVQRRLEEMRDADTARPAHARQYRTLTQEHFRRVCAEAGGVSSPDSLLAYLHNAGIVFYRPGLFRDDVILDQGWALDAIYAIFHREKSVRNIRRNQGRFSRADLDDWLWRELGHDIEEQKLFLSMMQSCGICFTHRRLGPDEGDEREYIAPELLPDRAAIEDDLAQRWEESLPTEEMAFTYALLHPGLIRSIVSRIGKMAGLDARYWRGGVYVYETETRSRAIIEQEMIDDWRGRIRLQAQRGQAALLLQRLRKLVEDEQNKAGMTPADVTSTAEARRADAVHKAGIRGEGEEMPATPAPSFGQEPSAQPEWCVSYAWGDATPEGRQRQEIVDRLCASALSNGKRILRDKTDVGLGEEISRFMRRIGKADRVFVVLSDTYLKSPFCMFELAEIWRTARQEDAEFRRRIRVWTLPCARIWSPLDRAQYAIHWKQEHDRLEVLVREHGYDILGEKDLPRLRRMRDFSRNVGDILASIADTLLPRSFEDLERYGFAD